MSQNKPEAAQAAPTNSLLFVLALSASVVLLFIMPQTVSGQAGGGSCHLRELDLCAASMLVFTQHPNGLATSDAEINKQCIHLREASGCMRNYTRRCMTPIQRELINFVANASFQLLDEYCSNGSKLRQGYLKHAQCLNQVQKRQEHKTCLRDLQTALELITSNQQSSSKQELQKTPGISAIADSNGKRLKMACCAFRRLETCLGTPTEKRCGKETILFVQTVARRATSRLPETVCRNFKPDGAECRALLPKNGTIPRGSKSSSIISRLLSAYSGL